MSEDDLREQICQAKTREDRYRWMISIILVITSICGGFMGGMLFQTERTRDQIVTNTVEIRILKESLEAINEKLDIVLAAKKASN
ncbi:MAG: hypothetical protein AVO39_11075 [delta proteobacterium MLS_D]|nr:MAG: hypothetical protein AVO39_11075 [delta proteobacterium MLS_D]